MDVDRHVVSVNSDTVPMPLKEFELLEFLLRNAGRVLTRGQLIDRIWGSDYVGDTKTLDVHVKRLRAKIEPSPSDAAAPADRPRAGLQVRALTEPLEPDVTSDELEIGWGDDLGDGDDRDDDLVADRPPHYDER